MSKLPNIHVGSTPPTDPCGAWVNGDETRIWDGIEWTTIENIDTYARYDLEEFQEIFLGGLDILKVQSVLKQHFPENFL